MKVVLVDNGSLEPASHAGLRAAALAMGRMLDMQVEAVSWRHSDRIRPADLEEGAAHTLAPWMREQVSAGERDFLFVPFFISPQGAIGSALRGDLALLQDETGGFDFSFTDGLADGETLAAIVADRIRSRAASLGLRRPAVVVVDHGGPSQASARVRDRIAASVRDEIGESVRTLQAASMESPQGAGFEFNRPLLAEALTQVGSGDVVIAPLFLLPGRHAGGGGDLEKIALEAQERAPGLRCHFTELVGTHPLAIETLAGAVTRALGAAVLQ